MEFTFPDGFLWGAGTAGHQIEGQNVSSDWWHYEHQEGTPCSESSGDACDFFNRYPEDIAMMRDFGYNAFRFSVEWSRVEPERGEFSVAALQHYKRVAQTCIDNGIKPSINFNHGTMPYWCMEPGGWLWDEMPELFANYSDRVARALADELDYVWTLNEPDLMVNLGHRYGVFPGPHAPGAPVGPGEEAAKISTEHLRKGHELARDRIRQAAPHAKVGFTIATTAWEVIEGYEEQAKKLRDQWDGGFFDLSDGDDFIGAMPYTRMFVGPSSGETGDALPPMFMMYPPDTRRTLMGWEYYPEAVEDIIRTIHAETGLPIIVAESGVPTYDDTERVEFIERGAVCLANCLRDGIDVRGYHHWTLFNDYSWHLGFRMHFGLVEVDRETLDRTPKPSAYRLGEIAKANKIELPAPATA